MLGTLTGSGQVACSGTTTCRVVYTIPGYGNISVSGISVFTYAAYTPTTSTVVNSLQITPVNSTTYVDNLGISLGIQRLPGEIAPAFLTRLYKIGQSKWDHSYEGQINQLVYEFGLNLGIIGTIGSPNLNDVISINTLGGISLTTNGTTTTIPLMTLYPDGSWIWRLISEVFTDINNTNYFTAILTGIDAPSIKLVNQSNRGIKVGELIVSSDHQLDIPGIIVGTELFNTGVPSYTILNNLISFQGGIPLGTKITYDYILSPFNIVYSDVNLISVSNIPPNVIINNVVPTTLLEAVSNTETLDPSYWGN